LEILKNRKEMKALLHYFFPSSPMLGQNKLEYLSLEFFQL